MIVRTLSDLAQELGGELLGPGDLVISGVSGLEDAGPEDLSFVAHKVAAARVSSSRAGALIVGPDFAPDRPAIRMADPHKGFVRILALFVPDIELVFPAGIHPTAVVSENVDMTGVSSIGPYCVIGPNVVLGQGTRLGPHVILEAGVVLGKNCKIFGRVTIRYGCQIGDRVSIHPGAVIGSDGFGYLPGPEGLEKIPQVGIVVIEDDVEIGAGVCVDRATAGRTVIAKGTKIDNLVQIGHNVKIGAHCALSAQVGVAGTVTIEEGVVAGGQVGIGDHLHIGAGAKLAGKSGVWRDVPAGATVFGYPALNIKEAFRITSAMRRLPELVRIWRKLAAQKGDSQDQE